jgi:3',5'-cyclic-AMP phosphodiesterase
MSDRSKGSSGWFVTLQGRLRCLGYGALLVSATQMMGTLTRHVRNAVLGVLSIATVMSCAKFEDSPYATEHDALPRHVNLDNLQRLAAQEPFDDDTITILFTGDSQRFYEEQEAIVDKANQLPGIDLFILAGDLVDFGLAQEFAWTYQRLQHLDMPWLVVVGNHDLQANGAILFQETFGPLNFSFTYKGHKFLFHDTNGREYGNTGTVPDMSWLSAQMADPVPEHLIAVSHVPPMNGDFDPALVGPYTQQLASDERLMLSLHAHQGSYLDGYPYGPGVRYIVCNAMSAPEFLLLRIHHGQVDAQVLDYMQ